jgi:hypothetical protein
VVLELGALEPVAALAVYYLAQGCLLRQEPNTQSPSGRGALAALGQTVDLVEMALVPCSLRSLPQVEAEVMGLTERRTQVTVPPVDLVAVAVMVAQVAPEQVGRGMLVAVLSFLATMEQAAAVVGAVPGHPVRVPQAAMVV